MDADRRDAVWVTVTLGISTLSTLSTLSSLSTLSKLSTLSTLHSVHRPSLGREGKLVLVARGSLESPNMELVFTSFPGLPPAHGGPPPPPPPALIIGQQLFWRVPQF